MIGIGEPIWRSVTFLRTYWLCWLFLIRAPVVKSTLTDMDHNATEFVGPFDNWQLIDPLTAIRSGFLTVNRLLPINDCPYVRRHGRDIRLWNVRSPGFLLFLRRSPLADCAQSAVQAARIYISNRWPYLPLLPLNVAALPNGLALARQKRAKVRTK